MEMVIITFLSTVLATVVGGMILDYILRRREKKNQKTSNESKHYHSGHPWSDRRVDHLIDDSQKEVLELPKEDEINPEEHSKFS